MATKKSNPYELNSSDTPGNIITQVQLKRDTNYEEWARTIKFALRARRKWVFVDGTLTKPKDNEADLEEWGIVQSMVISWILNTIDPKLRSTISYHETTADLWKEIKNRFSVSNGPKIQYLRRELANCRQQGESVADYVGRLTQIWDELSTHDDSVVCTYNKYECKVNTQFKEKREKEKVHEFLMGLNDALYSVARSNILANKNMPSLDRVYSTMIQEEKLCTMMRTVEERHEPVALVVQGVPKGRGRGDTKQHLVCTHCNRQGHEASGCFQIIGYSEWWGDRPRGGRASGNKFNGGRGQGGGQGRGSFVRTNFAQSSNGDRGGDRKEKIESKETSNSEQWPSMSYEQWQEFVTFVNSKKQDLGNRMEGKDHGWIIDTGATNHMTRNHTCFSQWREIDAFLLAF